MTLPEAYRSQAQYIQASPKFYKAHSDAAYEPKPFPGYSIITPPWADDTENSDIYRQLQTLQETIDRQLPPDLFVPLPPDSFHMTLADLIWDSAFYHANENPEFEAQLRDRIAQSFALCQPQMARPLQWQAIGLVLMPRALGIALAPKDEYSYDQVFKLRRSIYQNSDLIGLGIEQQYHFTGHITLGYFGNAAANPEGLDLSTILDSLNNQWLSAAPSAVLSVHRAELRKFDDMTRYYREADWPVLTFG